ncbi:hypothetical protein Busp01_54170 [Trinickia caryophylli]|uniref:General secretion pathway protein C n=1 Tax=Trinickia caryophylli TaxID=28094 RepID=A0A1X7H6N9_TRICW|nr:general secretion pathway protein GspC [Trinickia caryophylli]GLU35575.1 hypothetical protein Busp01_54170 [Trinickia caryophylli]SMF79812.1 general secretion pathway protein C [Trinickia caryophylli]
MPALPRVALVLRLPAIATVLAAVVLAAALAGWTRVLLTPLPSTKTTADLPKAPDTRPAARLFGAHPERMRSEDVRLVGILAFDARHAAALLAVDGNPPRAVPLGGEFADASTLVEVRERSVIVERRGVRREVALAVPAHPDVFLR